MSGCWRSNCRILLLLLLRLRLLVVQLDWQGNRPPPQPYKEDLNLAVGLGLLLPSHRVVGEHSSVDRHREDKTVSKADVYSTGCFILNGAFALNTLCSLTYFSNVHTV